jgi:transposase
MVEQLGKAKLTDPSRQGSIQKNRDAVERGSCRLKDFRRIAMRYDKLARNFFSSVTPLPLLRFGSSLIEYEP